MARPLSPLLPSTRQRLDALFAGADAEAAERLLTHECGYNLPLVGDWAPEEIARLRLSALKVSGGDLDRLREAVALAKVDWRDLLMWAGFGHDASAHERWMPRGDTKAEDPAPGRDDEEAALG
ncbi:MAG: hypothetical protein AAF845_03745 [Bacteroidota bacterium]